MTAKEFVKGKCPKATAERQVRGRIKGMQEVYWLIRERGHTMYMASGNTESKAWKNAKEHIIEREKSMSETEQAKTVGKANQVSEAKAKHTEGKLSLSNEGENGLFLYVETWKHKSLARVYHHDGVSMEETEANANRIVKAWNSHDELLKALKDILHVLEAQNNFEHHAVKSNAYSAIKNAK